MAGYRTRRMRSNGAPGPEELSPPRGAVALAAAALAIAAAVLAASCAPRAPNRTPAAAITWQSWEPAAFERAAAEHKLIVVDAGIEGCTACRDMHEETFRDPAVVAWMSAHAISISVDADAQPDLGERFDPWGWPAIGILAPSGQTLWMIRGYRAAPRFLAILQEVEADFRAGKTSEVKEPPVGVASSDLEGACREAVSWLDERGGEHGWGRGSVAEAPVQLAMSRRAAFGADAKGPNEAQARAHALGIAKLVDPEWGGIFVAPTAPDWSGFIPEKRTWTQAAALSSFAAVAGVERSGQALAAAAQIDRYLQDVMKGSDGLYMTTEAEQVPNLPAELTAVDYYRLRGEERLKYGRPVLDHAAYTAENGLLALGYLQLYQATGDDLWLRRGRELLDALVATRMTTRGFLRQAATTADVQRDRRLRELVPGDEGKLFLRPQVQVGYALLRLHELTGELTYLEIAVRLAAELKKLAATDGGYTAAEPRDTDKLFPPRAPAFDNAWAARFLLALAAATGDEAYRAEAAGVLRSIKGVAAAARSEGVNGAGVYALALHEYLLGAVDVSVTGKLDDPRGLALRQAGLRELDGRVFAHFDTHGKYPTSEAPTAYVCTATACSSPQSDPLALRRRITDALRTHVDLCQVPSASASLTP